MFCPKCHTELDDDTQICKRCGTKVNSKSTNLWGSFSSSKSFERMNTKNIEEIDEEKEQVAEIKEELLTDHNETHQEQYNYSKEYSDVKNDNNEEHHEQYNYSKEYSDVKKDNNEEHHEQYTYSENYSNTNQEQVTSEQDYINAYIGNNAFINLPFSIPAALLGPFYYLYKKMFSIGIILIIIYIASYIYLSEDLGLILRLIINIILAAKFNSKYREDVEKRIQLIKNQNQNATSTELLEICKKKGQPLSIGILIIIIILYFTSIAALLVNEPNKNEEIQNIKEDYSIDNLHYKIPKSIEEVDEYTNYQFFKDKNEKGTCFISIYVHNTNMTEKEFIVSQSTSYEKYRQNDIEVVDIKNNKWSKRTFEGNTQKAEMYVMKKKSDNKIYELDFEESPSNSEACKEDRDYIFNNLEIK